MPATHIMTRHGLSRHELLEAAHRGLRAIGSIKNLRRAAEVQGKQIVRTLEIQATAFGFGFARGYFADPGKDLAILGVPVDVAVGLAGHGVAFLGLMGKAKDDTHNIADGALASYGTTLGLKLGVEAKSKSTPSGAAKTSGVGMSTDQIASALAAAI